MKMRTVPARPAARPASPKADTAQPDPAVRAEEGDADVPGEEIVCRVRRVIYQMKDSGFTVLAVRTEDREEVSLQAHTSQSFRENDRIVARGDWVTYKGRPQFKAASVRPEIPKGASGVVAWLKGGAVPGVGPAAVKKLLATFGESLPEAMRDADTLGRVVTKRQAAALAHAWNANAGLGELEAKLREMGLLPRQAVKVIEQYGARAPRQLKTDPWAIFEIEGIGFKTCDRIAETNGLDMRHPSRLDTGLRWALNESLNRNGHCGLPPGALLSAAAAMLDLEQEDLDTAMEVFLSGGRVVVDDVTGLVYPPAMLATEEAAAKHLAALLVRSRARVSPEVAEDAVRRAERELGKELDRDGGQLEAAIAALSNSVTIITGGPGTGKSTTQEVIVKAQEMLGRGADDVRLGAPTGRAAKRLAETSGREAMTIHRLLDWKASIGGFAHDANNPLKLTVAILDEISMVDLRLFASLVEAMPLDSALVLVGDADQLPSVGPGQVLRDLIASGLIPVARLTRVHRQAEGSGIAVAAQRINRGESPEEAGGRMRGFKVVHKPDHALFAEIVRLVRFELPERGFDPMKDVQVVAAMRVGEVGVDALNAALKAALNPVLPDGRSIRMPTGDFTIGDRVMQIRNDYEKGIYNGEVGTVTGVGYDADPRGGQRPWVTADFGGVVGRYTPASATEVALAYATSVHKVQGCEAPFVVFAAPWGHRRMLGRNLLYTGVTRARLECLVVGDKATVDEAPKKADFMRRHTGLRERLVRAVEAERMAA
jgi:exodeoxyribonuclease V alpha subunit